MLRREGGKWHQSAPWSLEQGVPACCSQGSPPRRVNNFPSFILGNFFRSQFSKSVSKLFACLEQHSTPWALSQPSLLTFKIPSLTGLMWPGSVLVFQERVSLPWNLHCFNLEKQSCQGRGVDGFGVKKDSVHVSCPQQASQHLFWGVREWNGTHQLFCPWRSNATFQRCSPKRVKSLHVILRLCHMPCACLPAFSSGVKQYPQISIPGKPMDL